MLQRLGKYSPRVKELRRRVRDRRPGEVVVDGRRLVSDLVRWGVPLRELYIEDAIEPDPEVVSAAEAAWSVDGKVLSGISPTRHPQGVLAVVDEPAQQPWSGSDGVGLYLDGIQDPGNVGAIIRCAAALGASAVMLSPGSVDPYHPAAIRGSAGTVFRLPVEREASLTGPVERVTIAGGEVWASGTSGVPLTRWSPTQPILLLLGAEGAGLSGRGLDAAGGQVTIPLAHEVESLNVAVAAGILLQHLRQK
jgi:TrmH family RNA methyltransferase